MTLTGPAIAAQRLNISEPFNFQHITHTSPHQVQKLERANPDDLVSEFSALRASQVSQPELKGIKTKDIQREDLSRDALLPDCPPRLRNGARSFPPLPTSRCQEYAPNCSYGATSPEMFSDYSRYTDNDFQPSAAYHTAQRSPTSPHSQTSRSHPTPDLFTFHNESHSDMTFEQPIPTESPEPSDYSTSTWDDGFDDLASPHAVTTDDRADWHRQVPFSLVRTELTPVEEDDENEDTRSLMLPSPQRSTTSNTGLRNERSFPNGTFYWSSNSCPQGAGNNQGRSSHQTPPAEESPSRWSAKLLPEEEDVPESLKGHRVLSANSSELSIEDTIDDIPFRPRVSRHISVGPNDMEGFWDMASDAINCSYALGAEGDSNFDWYRSSFHEDDVTAPTTDEIQPNAADTPSDLPIEKAQSDLPSPSAIAARRSSSVYSSSPTPLLPLQTFPSSAADPPSACSTESSFSSIPEAITPNDTAEPAMTSSFPIVNCKEWYHPAYDLETGAVQEDLFHQIYAAHYSQEAPFPIHNVGRIDGSTISNSPRSSRSPISKSSSQESFWYTQAALNARRPRNAGSVGSLPELMSSKNSRERFDSAVDQPIDSSACLNPSDSPSDGQQSSAAQRRRSPNLARDAAQNIILSKVRTAEEPLPPLRVSRERAISDVTHPVQESHMLPPPQPAAGRRMRSGSSASSLSARGSKVDYNQLPPPPLTPGRNL